MPDGRVNPDGMTSFNHHALGAVVDWLHRCESGLAPLEPGYRTTLDRPLPGGGLTWAETRHISPYGEISVSWGLDGAKFDCEVGDPPGASALLVLPIAGWATQRVTSGSHRFRGRFELVPPARWRCPPAPSGPRAVVPSSCCRSRRNALHACGVGLWGVL